jgi:hypothetical protein
MGGPVPDYLFVFGYESPADRRTNRKDGTDFESSNAIWVRANSKETALDVGKCYAQQWVAELFTKQGISDYEGWLALNFAHWIKDDPANRFPDADLTDLVRI